MYLTQMGEETPHLKLEKNWKKESVSFHPDHNFAKQ